ncbi:hypothetical protein GOV03_00465 [Candidatus Woesearchaeota archaeon]|nr:hypothetical protein [Candidatus Woesearchaeota archaeon]
MTKIGLPKAYIQYTGLFDFDGFYAAMIKWLKEREYEWHEKGQKHKVPTPKGAELEWNWEGRKEVTDYIKYVLGIKAHLWDITEVKVDQGRRKKKLMNGRIQLVMSGQVITDWQKKWGKNKFTKFLGRLYEKMIRREIEAVYIDTLYYRMWDLHAVIKKYFDMQTKWNEYNKYLKED